MVIDLLKVEICASVVTINIVVVDVFLVYHVILLDHVIKGSYDSTLPMLVSTVLALVEI